MLPKIIIDTDIGDDIDDAFAIILAVLSNKYEILGITTCYRNAKKRAKIAKYLLQSLASDIEVYAGADLALNQEVLYADFDKFDQAGEVIMPGYYNFMDEIEINAKSAVDFMAETIENNPGEITIVSIGPMTNLASLSQRYPESFTKIKQILFMGGQTETPFKEWNIRNDVEAAITVFESEVPLKMVGLNVTSKTILDQQQVQRILNLDDSGYHKILKQMLQEYLDFFDGRRQPIMHDPLTVSCLSDDFCSFENYKVELIGSGIMRGVTKINSYCQNKTIEVATEVNAEAFIEYLMSVVTNSEEHFDRVSTNRFQQVKKENNNL